GRPKQAAIGRGAAGESDGDLPPARQGGGSLRDGGDGLRRDACAGRRGGRVAGSPAGERARPAGCDAQAPEPRLAPRLQPV
ncbi:MAG: hypothetical protein AVDCRST_MAG55-144, partial [uncultured Rubrobacteraceae bacterium]